MCPHNLNWWVATKLMYILNIPGVHKRLEGPQTSTANSWMARDYAIRPWPFTHNIQLAHDEIRCHALWQRTRQRLCQQLTAVYECRKTWFPVWQPILRITKWVQSAWRTPSGTHVTWLDTTWSPDKEIDCTLWCPYDLSAHQSPKHCSSGLWELSCLLLPSLFTFLFLSGPLPCFTGLRRLQDCPTFLLHQRRKGHSEILLLALLARRHLHVGKLGPARVDVGPDKRQNEGPR